MNIWENAVLTDKGTALQAKLVDGQTLHITKVVSGGAKVPVVNLRQQTNVTDGGKEITLQPVRIEGDKTVLPVLLENTGLEEGYDLWQVGIYAQDPEEGEILYCLAQASEAKHIPSAKEGPGFSVTWDFVIKTSNTAPFEVDVNSVGLVSIEQYQVHAGEIHRLKNSTVNLDERIEGLNSALVEVETEIEKKADKTSLDNTNSQLDKFANRKILINRGSVNANASSTVDARVNFTEAFSSIPIVVIGLEGAVMNRRVSVHTIDRTGFTVTARNDSTTSATSVGFTYIAFGNK